MWPILAIILAVSEAAASGPSLAQKPAVSPIAKPVETIVSHLDLNSFPNSTGARRRVSAHVPADYGFTKIEGFPDGWVQFSQADDSWHIGALLLQRSQKTATLCFTDSAGADGTYRSTQVLEVRFDGHARWTGVPMVDRPDCKNVPADRSNAADGDGPAPAAVLEHLDDFRDSLSSKDRNRLDQALPRSIGGGIAQCGDTNASRASCETAAYMPALHRVGLMRRFLASPGPILPASGLQRQIDTKGAAAVVASLSPAIWDVALDSATAGRSDWIEAIASLRTATDGAHSEDIDRAMSDALLTNPSAVLRQIEDRPALPGVAWLCQDRSIEPTNTASSEYVRAATAAVQRVTDPKLITMKDQCLGRLKNT